MTITVNTGNAAFEGQYQFVEYLAAIDPELRALVDRASAQHVSADTFQSMFMATAWYRQHSATARQALALQASDPTTFNNQLAQTTSHLQSLADQMGVSMSSAQLQSLAHASMFGDQDDDALKRNIGNAYTLARGQNQGGQGVSLEQQIRQLAQQYGVPVTDTWVQGWVRTALSHGQGVEGAQESLMNSAKSMYPGLAKQIDAGQTTIQIAQPYVAQMSQTLEIPDSQITASSVTIQRALRGDGTNPTPLYQFQNQLRQDPRWGKTNNAKQEAYGMLSQLGRAWGFAS